MLSFCLQFSSFSVLINGSSAGFFGGSRVLKQSDPLSPFLFIMVSDILSRMIKKAEMGYISGFRLGSKGDTISHFQFVDDRMIFCDADVKHMGYLRYILRCFEVLSRLEINLAKSGIF